MKTILFFLAGILLAGMTYGQSISPEVLGSAGDYYSGATTSVSWTVGEAVVTTVSNTNNSISQGFQQPSYTIVAVAPEVETLYEVKVYPNPTAGMVFFELNREDQVKLQVDLIDMHGRVLTSLSTVQKQDLLQFDLSQVALGSYFIRAYRTDGKTVKNFKIQKTL